MDSAIDDMLSNPDKALDLANIRFQLMWVVRSYELYNANYHRGRLEDTITFHLIERVQCPLNPKVYDAEALPIPCLNPALPEKLCLGDYILSETERVHSLARRYEAPDEYPYFPEVLQRPLLKSLQYPTILHPNNVNVNATIKRRYVQEVLPAACRKFDRLDRGERSENYGSAATCDVQCLQALSRRIHFGKFVAESKFRKETDRFVKLIKDSDRKGIDEAITDAAVEKKVLERLRLKAITYGTDPSEPTNGDGDRLGKIDVEAVVDMYKSVVIPLTKEVEVEYLMQRLKGTQWE